jgi:hypothetical protein
LKTKRFTVFLIILISTLIIGISLNFFLSSLNKTENTNPRGYMLYQGKETRIYLLNSSDSFSYLNQAYTSSSGIKVENGTQLFTITQTLRNDYTSENPPPPPNGQVAIAPADGTAYICLKSYIYNNKELNATDVSIADFSLPTISGSGFVLSSGETKTITIYLLTPQTNMVNYRTELYFLGDSIPLNSK